MLYLALSVGVTIVLFIVLGIQPDGRGDVKIGLQKRQFFSALGFLVMIFSFFSIVPANNVGVLYSPFSGVRNETLQEGLHTKSPLDKVYKISTEVQSGVIQNVYGQTKDAQYMTMTIDIKYRVDNETAFEVFRQFRTLDRLSETLIAPVVQRSVESVTTQYNVIDILGEARNDVYALIEKDLRERLGASGVTFYSIAFSDTDAGEQIETAIRAEAVAKKAVETAEQEKQKAVVEAEKLKIETQAKVDAAIIESEGLAKRLKIEAEGQAESYRIKNAALNDNILFLEWLDKWNGELPKVQGDSAGLMMDISTILD